MQDPVFDKGGGGSDGGGVGDGEDLAGYYYEYQHGNGRHVYVPRPPPPTYSLHCCCQYGVDGLILILIVGFLLFAFWLCYYIYNNYGDWRWWYRWIWDGYEWKEAGVKNCIAMEDASRERAKRKRKTLAYQ